MSYTIKTPHQNYLDNGTMQPTIKWLKQNVTKEDVFIDVGAHIGAVFVEVAGTTNPKIAIAFEPTPEACGYLRENCNQLGANVEVNEAAVSNEDGEGHLYEADWGSPSNSMIDRFKGTRPAIKVKTVRLDSFKAVLDDHPIVIKIDAELSEPQVWEGMKGILPQVKAVCMELFFEAYRDVKIDIEPFLNQIREDGFKIYTFNGKEMLNEELLGYDILDVVIKR